MLHTCAWDPGQDRGKGRGSLKRQRTNNGAGRLAILSHLARPLASPRQVSPANGLEGGSSTKSKRICINTGRCQAWSTPSKGTYVVGEKDTLRQHTAQRRDDVGQHFHWHIVGMTLQMLLTFDTQLSFSLAFLSPLPHSSLFHTPLFLSFFVICFCVYFF